MKTINVVDAGDKNYECVSTSDTLRLKMGEIISESDLQELINTKDYKVNIKARKPEKE